MLVRTHAAVGRALRTIVVALLTLAIGSVLPACDDASSDDKDASFADPEALPGCAEYCDHRSSVCGESADSCLLICSHVNRDAKTRCLDSVEAVNLCYATSGSVSCDGGTPEQCIDEIGRLSSCFETDGGSATGCVKTFGGGTCTGDFVDGRTAQKTCYPGVPIPEACISISEILALRGYPDKGPPPTNPDGTLIDSAVVCCDEPDSL